MKLEHNQRNPNFIAKLNMLFRLTSVTSENAQSHNAPSGGDGAAASREGRSGGRCGLGGTPRIDKSCSPAEVLLFSVGSDVPCRGAAESVA